MVYRVYVEKKAGYDNRTEVLKQELYSILGIEGISGIRILARYDVEGISKELFDQAVADVLADPITDFHYDEPETDEGDVIFTIEYLPGQFDQRADSASECIQLISKGERPNIRSAVTYVISGDLTEADIRKIKEHLINPVESREASSEIPDTLEVHYDEPKDIEILNGFTNKTDEEITDFIELYGLAMDPAALIFVRDHYREEGRDPSITELRVIDTYWSDHCRHTTFNTIIDSIEFKDKKAEKAYVDYLETRAESGDDKPISLMDIGTVMVRYLGSQGMLDKLDISEEVNACTVCTDVTIDGKKEDWLLLFKNETHNHPTEIEPFGGAATCIGGAIRDPLSGRSYVYQAMRVTGAGDPLTPIGKTPKGKLPQSKIVKTAAEGYSSYGNQIGLATGLVDEIYHPGYVAKRMEVGAVIAAAPRENVVREKPEPGDSVILLGGRTGRDGIGGATGSSKSHTEDSLNDCGAEVQKGNAPEERKLQRLFRNPKASKLIKKSNDFGAGGVSVAIGELAEGLEIDLDKVPRKYEGLDGTELAISESQERMAVVLSEEDEDDFIRLCEDENIEATKVAEVIEDPYLRMYWRGNKICDIPRAFLDTNGVTKHIKAYVKEAKKAGIQATGDFKNDYLAMASSLNCSSKRGLSERFDSTIGSGAVLMPFGGKNQRTPVQSMISLISTEKGHTEDVSVMAYGFDPEISENDPYAGGYISVISSVAKLAATGTSIEDTYLSLQEYFPKPGIDEKKWGLPVASVLGAFEAEKGLSIAAIGGKDSMSGTFESLEVPPTLITFAVTTSSAKKIVSPEFKEVDDKVVMLLPDTDSDGLPKTSSFKDVTKALAKMIENGAVNAIYTPSYGGVAEAIMKMSMGNDIGFRFNPMLPEERIFEKRYGSFIVELKKDFSPMDLGGIKIFTLGKTIKKREIGWKYSSIGFDELFDAYESKLESIYVCNTTHSDDRVVPKISHESKQPEIHVSTGSRPKVFIPVFPGTNCEYDTVKAFEDAGSICDVGILNNMDKEHVERSVEDFASRIRNSQMIFIPGGFSGGDEPDGSAKLISAFFRNPEVKEAVEELLDIKQGLIAGVCNGFQALIKLGLVPYGKITDPNTARPTLSYNTIGRHQSKLVYTRVCSDLSPWMRYVKVGDIYKVPVSHGEGRFTASEEVIRTLSDKGQILTQYVDSNGEPTMDINFNPNGSSYAIEGITSPDGRVLGKMGHIERVGKHLYKNVPGESDMKMFKAATDYFK